MLVASLVAVILLALVHLVAGRLRFLERTPRSIWLSMAGGVSVAYIFVHLLPELNEGQEAIAETTGGGLAFLEHHVYLVALLGLVIFYGLERAALGSRRQQHGVDGGDRTTATFFWLHVASFAVYNALIGYFLLHREEGGLAALLVFAAAMALHFVVNDFGLREHHKSVYDHYGRWVLAAAVLVGWACGLVVTLSQAALAVLLAFLAGGVILNVLKEELPEERDSRFWAFTVGASGYTALLLLL